MALVQGSNVLLKISNGGALATIACNASCTMELSTDTLETTFEESGAHRSFIPNKHTTTLRGNGPIVMGQSVLVSDIVQYQYNKTVIAWEFRYTDGTNIAVYSGSGFFTQVTVDGAVGQAAQCDYTIQVTGEVLITAAPPTGDGDPQIYEYTATETIATVSEPDLIGAVLLIILREGIGIEIITIGTPNSDQVKFTSATGTLEWGTPLTVDEYVNGIYLE